MPSKKHKVAHHRSSQHVSKAAAFTFHNFTNAPQEVGKCFHKSQTKDKSSCKLWVNGHGEHMQASKAIKLSFSSITIYLLAIDLT